MKMLSLTAQKKIILRISSVNVTLMGNNMSVWNCETFFGYLMLLLLKTKTSSTKQSFLFRSIFFHIFINLEIFKAKTKWIIRESHGNMENFMIHGSFEKTLWQTLQIQGKLWLEGLLVRPVSLFLESEIFWWHYYTICLTLLLNIFSFALILYRI